MDHQYRVTTVGHAARIAAFLPGAGWYGDVGRPLAEATGDIVTTHLLDLPGFGGSRSRDRIRVLPDVSPWLVGYLNSGAIEQVDLIGHSLGGAIGLTFAVEHPERVRSLTLLDIGYARMPRFPTAMLGVGGYLVPVVNVLHHVFGDGVLGKEASLARPQDPTAEQPDLGRSAAALLIALYRADLPGLVRRLTVPTLLLYGHDPKASAAGQARQDRHLAAVRPSSYVELAALRGGHYAHEKDAMAVEHLRSFLART